MKKVLGFLYCTIIAIAVMGFSTSCTDKLDTYYETLVVASKYLIRDGERAYYVKVNDSPKWELMWQGIIGFDYEEGYEYKLVVKYCENKESYEGADMSSHDCYLIKIVSKEKKDSEVVFLTKNLSLIESHDEVAFPDKKAEQVTLPNGLVLDKIDSLYVYEGDVVLNEKQVKEYFGEPEIKSGVTTSSVKYWPRRTVYYTFAQGFTLKQNVLSAIQEWTNKTSLKFIEGKGSGNYIEFFHDNNGGNYSNSIGRKGGKQQISLSQGSSVGNAIHEIGHAVGLIHEHCRNDRDDYININWSNIQSSKISQFQKYPSGAIRDIGDFDFNSIMLYSSKAFQIDTTTYTMTTKDGYFFNGQRLYLSLGDINGVRSAYGPPFPKMEVEINVVNEFYDYADDYYETEENSIIRFYSDEACTQPAPLTYPRTITYTVARQTCNAYCDPILNTYENKTITIPAGSYGYNFGTVTCIQYYRNGNPLQIDVTKYYID